MDIIKKQKEPSDTELAAELQEKRDEEPKQKPPAKKPVVAKSEKPSETDQDRALELAKSHSIMQWESPEFIYYEKGRNWFIVAAIVFTALIAYSIFGLKSVISTIVFISLFILIYLFAQKKPQEMGFIIAKYGIVHGTEYYPYKEVKRFWIDYDPPHLKELHIEVNRMFASRVTVQLLDINPVKVRKLLIAKIPEDDNLASDFSDALARLLRF